MVSFIGNKANPPLRKSLIELTEDYSILMNEKSRKHSWKGMGPLSLKVALRGEANYNVKGKKMRIDKNRCLVLNDFQEYEINVNSPYDTETFIIFFNRSLTSSVSDSVRKNDIQLLDDGNANSSATIGFQNQTIATNQYILHVIQGLQSMMAHETDHQIVQEVLCNLFDTIVRLELGKAGHSQKERASTQFEIQRRLSVAIDYMRAMYDQSITLDQLSKESCLSKNHLLRTFKHEHGVTPFQYLSALRFEKARDLLTHSDLPVSHICTITGFESLGYFSWMFKKQTGFSPTTYREQR